MRHEVLAAAVTTEDWWSEIDTAVLECVRECGATTPEEIGGRCGLSTAAATSVLAMLAREGRVRICLVEPVVRAVAAAA